VFSTRKNVFPETGSREAFKTPCLLDLLLFFPVDETFRKSTSKINRVLWRKEEDAIHFRTVANAVEREGELIQEHISKKSEEILEKHGFNTAGKRFDGNKGGTEEIEPGTHLEESPCGGEDRNFEKESQRAQDETFGGNEEQDPEIEHGSITEELICKAIEELNAGKPEGLQIARAEIGEIFENTQAIKANISLDDVLAKKQKESKRKKGSPNKETKEYVKNTVVHVQSSEKASYILNASCVEKMMVFVLAFLLHNGLLNREGQLLFFIDGAVDLRSAIYSIFSDLLSFKIILDWFHLDKKCKERLSSAMKGKQIRNKVLGHLTSLLWHGKIDAAISYLQGLNEKDIKNQGEIQRLIGYFERNRSFIPCYALRQKLGLRVSSNLVEKANDLVVSSRQKHNGMSWSTSGSNGLASVTSIHLNDEHSDWLLNHEIPFQFKNRPETLAA
jgi:hypothetical protein